MIEPVGNIGFAAPEMLVGYSKYTEQVDLWSLGVLLYFMLCGEFPYTHEQ
jgi:serine/threonine protein kinase